MAIIHMQTEEVQSLARKIQVSGDQIGEILRAYYTNVRGLEAHWNGQSADEYRQTALELWRTLDTLRGQMDELSIALTREVNQWLEVDSLDGKEGAAAAQGGRGEIHQVRRYRTGQAQPSAGEQSPVETTAYEKVVAHRYSVTRGTGRTVWRAYYRDEAGKLVFEDLPYSSKKPMPTHRAVQPDVDSLIRDAFKDSPDAAVSLAEDPYKEAYVAKGNLVGTSTEQDDAAPSLKWQHGNADPGLELDNGAEQIPGFGDLEYKRAEPHSEKMD